MKKGWIIALMILGVCAQATAGQDRNQKWDAGFNLSMADAQSTNNDLDFWYVGGGVKFLFD